MIPGILCSIRMETEDDFEKRRNFLDSDAFPVSGIDIWNGAWGKMPRKFSICDGTNGTPDLRPNYYIMKIEGDAGQK